MKKNKLILIIIACVLLAVFVLGVSGVIPFAGDDSQGEAGGKYYGAGRDRLVGVFITKEPLELFDMEGYFKDHADEIFSGEELSEEGLEAYEGKLYATLTDDPYTDSETGETIMTKKYVFEGVEGIACFAAYNTEENGGYWGSNIDEGISNANTAFSFTDAGENIELKGEIYLDNSTEAQILYFNNVYQTADGRVYAESGSSMAANSEVGPCTHTVKDEQTVKVNGKSQTISTNIEITLCGMDTPVSASVVQFDKNDKIVSERSYEPGKLPDSISAEPQSSYIVVENHTKSAEGKTNASRELYQPEDESLYSFYCRDDGICIKQYCEIIWD